MMKPKDKAKELVEKFNTWTSRHNSELHRLYDAKQCALICVDDILESHIFLLDYLREKEDYIKIKLYWKEVKQEIEKL